VAFWVRNEPHGLKAAVYESYWGPLDGTTSTRCTNTSTILLVTSILTQLAAKALMNDSSESYDPEAKCPHNEIMYNVKLMGGLKAGKFTDIGKVKSIKTCIRYVPRSLIHSSLYIDKLASIWTSTRHVVLEILTTCKFTGKKESVCTRKEFNSH